MRINLTQVLCGKSSKESVSFEFELDREVLVNTGIIESSPVKADAEISLEAKDELRVRIYYQCQLVFSCDRCLEPVKKTVENNVEKVIYLKKSDDEYNDDLVHFEGSNFNIGAFIEEDLIIQLPLQVLCSEKCLGLCPKCGANLNYTQCDCDDERIDPRLLELKKFFTNS